jgi:hypothetical protein
MPDERSRLEVVQALSEKLGPEVAAALMECVPPFSWMEITTKHDLAQLEVRMGLRFENLGLGFEKQLHEELRTQTWRLAKLVVGAQGIVVVVIAAIGLVLRFA